MCVGIPMQIVSRDGLAARCRSRDGREEVIDLSLVGEQEPGVWLLTFLGAARDVVEEAEALLIAKALEGLSLAMQGQDIGEAFADLETREPTLPPHLEAARQAGRSVA